MLAAIVGGVLVLAGFAAATSARRGTAQLEEGSPGAAVQTYLASIESGDLQTAAAQLDPSGRCTLEDLRSTFRPDSFRAVLEEASTRGADSTVTIRITETDGAPLGEGYSHVERYALVQVEGRWLLVGTPWPLFDCSGPAVKP